MVNTRKLKAKMVEEGMSVQEAARHLGVNKSTFYRKLQKPDVLISVRDVRILSEVLHISGTEAVEIFFAPEVA